MTAFYPTSSTVGLDVYATDLRSSNWSFGKHPLSCETTDPKPHTPEPENAEDRAVQAKAKAGFDVRPRAD